MAACKQRCQRSTSTHPCRSSRGASGAPSMHSPCVRCRRSRGVSSPGRGRNRRVPVRYRGNASLCQYTEDHSASAMSARGADAHLRSGIKAWLVARRVLRVQRDGGPDGLCIHESLEREDAVAGDSPWDAITSSVADDRATRVRRRHSETFRSLICALQIPKSPITSIESTNTGHPDLHCHV